MTRALLLPFTSPLSIPEQARDDLARAREYVSYVWNTFPVDDSEGQRRFEAAMERLAEAERACYDAGAWPEPRHSKG